MRRGSGKASRRRKLLVDTNILLLYVVGSLGPERIARHKRTDKYTIEDFWLFDRLLREFGGEIVVTPNVLTEVSNLLGQVKDRMALDLLALLGTLARDFDERYVPSGEAVEVPEFARLGLTDAAILVLAERDLTVLTDDIHLYLALGQRRIEAINFHHLRERAWEMNE